MYVIGKRKLPLVAMEKLVGLLNHAQESKSLKEKSFLSEMKQKIHIEKVKNKLVAIELLKNTYHNKCLAFKKRQEELEASLDSLDYLQNQKNCSKKLLKQIENRIIKGKEVYNETNWLLLIEKTKQIEREYKSTKALLKKLK
jgi:hypothetical protein